MGDYVRKTWQPNAEGGTPINAASLNNIEEGIDEAISATKKNKEEIENLEINLKTYADNNILYFSKSCKSTARSWSTLFQLPSTIDYTKYIPLVECSRMTNGGFLKVVPYNTSVTLWYENAESLQIEISSSGEVSFYEPGSSSKTFTVRVILLPVSTISIA